MSDTKCIVRRKNQYLESKMCVSVTEYEEEMVNGSESLHFLKECYRGSRRNEINFTQI